MSIPSRPIANRRRLEVRPFGCSSPEPLAVIRQRLLPPNFALLEELGERPLTKYVGHWARRKPTMGVGRTATDDDQAV